MKNARIDGRRFDGGGLVLALVFLVAGLAIGSIATAVVQ